MIVFLDMGYDRQEDDVIAVSSIDHGETVWAKPAGGMWAEVYQEEEASVPLYFNMNNVMLLMGEVEYNVPIRKVKLTSTLDGLTEIKKGTEITITADISGFVEDEIVKITWQYRPADAEDDTFYDIEGAEGFTYTYTVDAQNIHNEWRIVLTLKS